MKVRFSFPVTGQLRVHELLPIQLYDWSFDFQIDEATGFVNRLTIERSNVPKENWPTLIPVEQDPSSDIPRFPFAVNPKAYHFREFEEQLINLESYLSVYGLEEIRFRNLSVDWVKEDQDELDQGLFEGFSIGTGNPEPPCEPLDRLFLAKCIVASGKVNTQASALVHFRVGQSHFHNHRYLEAIRSFYICIESLFANGKTGQVATLKEFNKSQHLKDTIQEVLVNQSSRSLGFLVEKYPLFSEGITVDSILKFLFQLRGQVQHANAFNQGKWHPSRQDDFQHEAIFMINLVEHICWDIAERDIGGVQASENSAL